MHTPFARLVFFPLLIALMNLPAHAQDTGKVPGLDESKIPDWVKRQAASPQKAILSNAAPKPRPEVVPVRIGRAPGRHLPPPAMVPAAAGPASTASGPTVAEPVEPATVGPAPIAASPNPGPEPAPLPAAAETPAGLPPGLTLPMPAEPSPAPAAPAASAPAEPAEPAAPPSLELIERSDPVLTADLIDARLPEASVTVAFTVGTQGEVIAPQIVASSDRRLNRAVLRAVAQWRYAPVSEPRPHSVKFSFAVTP